MNRTKNTYAAQVSRVALIQPERPNGFVLAHVPSFSRKGKNRPIYGTGLDPKTGKLQCTCPDFVYRKQPKGQLCKHCIEFAANLWEEAK